MFFQNKLFPWLTLFKTIANEVYFLYFHLSTTENWLYNMFHEAFGQWHHNFGIVFIYDESIMSIAVGTTSTFLRNPHTNSSMNHTSIKIPKCTYITLDYKTSMLGIVCYQSISFSIAPAPILHSCGTTSWARART